MGEEKHLAAGALVVACNLSGRAFVERIGAIDRDLFAHVEQIDELPDGFAYRFPGAEPWAARVLDFIAVERRCCPFFTFEVVFEPNDGPLWLRLRGSAEVKAFIRAELDAGDRHAAARP